MLHAAVAVALFFFLMRLFESVLHTRIAGQLSFAGLAFAAALLFALHPVAVYAVGYLVQRTMLMATLFGLLAMLSWLHGSERASKPWLWGSVLFYYLAVFCKEHAIMLPAVLLALTVLLHEDWKGKIRSSWQVLVAMGCLALFVLFSKIGILGSMYEVGAPEMLNDVESNLNYPLSVLTQSALFFKYAGLWLLPNPNWMAVDMREPFAPSIWSGYLAALLAFLAWGALALWLLLKRSQMGLLGFALLFPWLMFMPEFSTIRIQESFVLYRSYLWAVGAGALLPLLLDKLDKQMAGVVITAIALAMLPISMDRLASFSHPLTLWDDAAKLLKNDEPLHGSARIYNNRGLEHLKVQNYVEALQDFQLSIRLNPNMPSAYTNMGAVYLKVGQPKQAMAAFDEAIAIMQRAGKVDSSHPFYGKAKAYEAMGELDEARNHYEISCKLGNKGCEKLVE
ncbi:MAG: tetratricopeptide repeat protein [Gammaproteobacteria bacterium]|nr:tetratricopeptide repeat protein [Gammaproteobacteria bacterium]MBU1625503.1 tetratricopeptide repeat protein [Gammaproteobacteria bacterium]MBU1980763.1 tetratricopeptide repeat protein [Gammaproteobacteria bacterium]